MTSKKKEKMVVAWLQPNGLIGRSLFEGPEIPQHQYDKRIAVIPLHYGLVNESDLD